MITVLINIIIIIMIIIIIVKRNKKLLVKEIYKINILYEWYQSYMKWMDEERLKVNYNKDGK